MQTKKIVIHDRGAPIAPEPTSAPEPAPTAQPPSEPATATEKKSTDSK